MPGWDVSFVFIFVLLWFVLDCRKPGKVDVPDLIVFEIFQ